MRDQETGLYYLQSRYYDPTLGRFINADAYASTGQGLLGNNMFAYCGNNPVNNVDPTGHAFMQITFDPTGISGMLTPGPWGGGSGGVSPGYTVGSVGPGAKHFLFTYSDSRDVQAGLKTYGYALYKGCLVTVADLPGEGSAFSYGIIVLDAYYKDAPAGEFAETLNHEYGHFIHMAQVGLPAYTATAAIPSFICAGLSHISPWIRNNYYSLPWERTADYLGGVDRGGYLPGADKGAFIYWSCTQAVSIF